MSLREAHCAAGSRMITRLQVAVGDASASVMSWTDPAAKRSSLQPLQLLLADAHKLSSLPAGLLAVATLVSLWASGTARMLAS